MIKKTLLEMVQNILSAMDSDEVNSIGDTVESLQVAEILKETYEEITVGIDIPGLEGLVQFDGVQDVDRPNVIKAPRELEKIDWLRYNGDIVEYLTPETFVRRQAQLNREGGANVVLVSGIPIRTDAHPRFYTSFDDDEMFFESFNSAEDSTLQQSKTLGWGKRFAEFRMEDDFIPLLPTNLFPRLLAEAKATCFINYKQVANSKEEQKSRRQLIRNQNDRYKNGSKTPIERLPNYGRSPRRVVSRRTP